jgi:hypothetical protein
MDRSDAGFVRRPFHCSDRITAEEAGLLFPSPANKVGLEHVQWRYTRPRDPSSVIS